MPKTRKALIITACVIAFISGLAAFFNGVTVFQIATIGGAAAGMALAQALIAGFFTFIIAGFICLCGCAVAFAFIFMGSLMAALLRGGDKPSPDGTSGPTGNEPQKSA